MKHIICSQQLSGIIHFSEKKKNRDYNKKKFCYFRSNWIYWFKIKFEKKKVAHTRISEHLSRISSALIWTELGCSVWSAFWTIILQSFSELVTSNLVVCSREESSTNIKKFYKELCLIKQQSPDFTWYLGIQIQFRLLE